MNSASILSLGSSALAVLLSVIMLFRGGSNLSLQTELQKRTQDVTAQQQDIQQQQQVIQAQQQQVTTAQQLAQQAGPQVIANLKVSGTRSKNEEIFALLLKYGVQTTAEEKEQIRKLLEEERAKNKDSAKPPASAPEKTPATTPAN